MDGAIHTAADNGAGIGRIDNGVHLHLCDVVAYNREWHDIEPPYMILTIISLRSTFFILMCTPSRPSRCDICSKKGKRRRQPTFISGQDLQIHTDLIVCHVEDSETSTVYGIGDRDGRQQGDT